MTSYLFLFSLFFILVFSVEVSLETKYCDFIEECVLDIKADGDPDGTEYYIFLEDYTDAATISPLKFPKEDPFVSSFTINKETREFSNPFKVKYTIQEDSTSPNWNDITTEIPFIDTFPTLEEINLDYYSKNIKFPTTIQKADVTHKVHCKVGDVSPPDESDDSSTTANQVTCDFDKELWDSNQVKDVELTYVDIPSFTKTVSLKFNPITVTSAQSSYLFHCKDDKATIEFEFPSYFVPTSSTTQVDGIEDITSSGSDWTFDCTKLITSSILSITFNDSNSISSLPFTYIIDIASLDQSIPSVYFRLEEKTSIKLVGSKMNPSIYKDKLVCKLDGTLESTIIDNTETLLTLQVEGLAEIVGDSFDVSCKIGDDDSLSLQGLPLVNSDPIVRDNGDLDDFCGEKLEFQFSTTMDRISCSTPGCDELLSKNTTIVTVDNKTLGYLFVESLDISTKEPKFSFVVPLLPDDTKLPKISSDSFPDSDSDESLYSIYVTPDLGAHWNLVTNEFFQLKKKPIFDDFYPKKLILGDKSAPEQFYLIGSDGNLVETTRFSCVWDDAEKSNTSVTILNTTHYVCDIPSVTQPTQLNVKLYYGLLPLSFETQSFAPFQVDVVSKPKPPPTPDPLDDDPPAEPEDPTSSSFDFILIFFLIALIPSIAYFAPAVRRGFRNLTSEPSMSGMGRSSSNSSGVSSSFWSSRPLYRPLPSEPDSAFSFHLGGPLPSNDVEMTQPFVDRPHRD